MIKKLANILLIVVLVIAALAIKDRYFPSVVTQTKTVTKTDTVYQDSIVYQHLPAPDPDTIIQYDTIIKKVTEPVSSGKYNDLASRFMKLYNSHHSSNIYDRTFIDDSTALIRVTDTVRENRLQEYGFTYKDRTPTVINKKVTNMVSRERKFFVGADFGMSTAAPALIYQSKNDINYKIGYDLQGPDQGPRFGVYISISNLNIW